MARAWLRALRRWRALALACAALAALGVRVPRQHAALLHFPTRAPAALAHDLADFSNQPHVESWSVQEDHSNYTTWRYSVQFSCGAQCAGRARVWAHDVAAAGAAPQHGRRAAEHRVRVERRACSAAPLLPWPWPLHCEELDTDAVVRGWASGAQLQEVSRTRCSVLGALSGACARWLQAQADLRRVRLQQLSLQAA